MKTTPFYQCEVCGAFYDNEKEAKDCEAVPMPPTPDVPQQGSSCRLLVRNAAGDLVAESTVRVFRGFARKANELGAGDHHWALVFDPATSSVLTEQDVGSILPA